MWILLGVGDKGVYVTEIPSVKDYEVSFFLFVTLRSLAYYKQILALSDIWKDGKGH